MSTIILLLALVCNAAILVIPLAGTNEPNGTLDAGVLSRISCAVEIVKASKDSKLYPRRVIRAVVMRGRGWGGVVGWRISGERGWYRILSEKCFFALDFLYY